MSPSPDDFCGAIEAELWSGKPSSAATRLQRYLFSPIRVDFLIEIQLLFLTFSTGIQDAISFPDFHCFASNQTGNSVVLAVGLAGMGGELFNVPNIGTSLGSFLAGAIVTGQIGNVVGPRRRAWLLLTHLSQTIMIFGAAAIQYSTGVRVTGGYALGAMTLLAFSSGAQVASMRPMRIPEITTAMATAAWVDLVVDPQVMAIRNHSRDRRALFLAALVAGSFAGAFMHPVIGSANALVVSAVGKLVVTLSLLLNREQQPDEERESL